MGILSVPAMATDHVRQQTGHQAPALAKMMKDFESRSILAQSRKTMH
jgi:hypothetical protein